MPVYFLRQSIPINYFPVCLCGSYDLFPLLLFPLFPPSVLFDLKRFGTTSGCALVFLEVNFPSENPRVSYTVLMKISRITFPFSLIVALLHCEKNKQTNNLKEILMDILHSSEPTQRGSLNTAHGMLSTVLTDDDEGDGDGFVEQQMQCNIRVSPAPPRAPRFAHQRVQYFRTMELHPRDAFQQDAVAPADNGNPCITIHHGNIGGCGDADDDDAADRSSRSLTQLDDQDLSPSQFVKIKLPSDAKMHRYPHAEHYHPSHNLHESQNINNDIVRQNDQHHHHHHQLIGSITSQQQHQQQPFMFVPALSKPTDANRWAHPHGGLLFAPSAEGGERFLLSPRRSSNATTPVENGHGSDDDDDDSLRTTSPSSSTLMPRGSPAFGFDRAAPTRGHSFAPPCLRRDTGLALDIPDFGGGHANVGLEPILNAAAGMSTDHFILYDD
ncbi:transmembrane protein, putative [Bodo saltans]|uniref:Transmembrane protein, putative n=1 Tax=Bodo saltans TaxID=75058 RepID=A0A0S4J2T3_BODSA|nr:transmembrane protein, putative [Bodo saltans]|eukprot:CUG28083.1 transmembrane protein, putative [Bodo saltans]